jgi:Zn-finger protein
MGKRHPKYSLVKINRNYTVDDAARLLGVHKNTVRAWIKSGLSVLDERRPFLILGYVLKEFLKNRRVKNKRPCKPGQFYCFKCRAPQYPAGNMAEYHEVTDKFGDLIASCYDCGTTINQRVSLSKIEQICSKINVSFPEAQRQLNESEKPSVNCDFGKETKTHEKTRRCKRTNQATIFDFLKRSQGAK